MKYLSIVAIWLLISHNLITVDPKLQKYVDSFEQYSEKYGRKVRISYDVRFADLKGNRAAVCYYSWLYGGALVEVDRNIFEQYPEHLRFSMLFHEFGHCSFNRQHSEEEINGTPASWMHWQIFFYDPKLKEEYIEEIMTGNREKLRRKL